MESSNEDPEYGNRRQHRGAGKSLTWDQFAFDKILPSIQAEFGTEQHNASSNPSSNEILNGKESPGASLSDPTRINWFGGFEGHKRSATTAGDLIDSFDLSSLSLGSHFAEENGEDDETDEKDLETISEAQSGFKSPPRHRRSHTHAATTSTFQLTSPSGFAPDSATDSFGWIEPNRGHLARTKSELGVSGIELASLREEPDWKLFSSNTSETLSATGRRSPSSAVSTSSLKANSVPGKSGSPLLRSPSDASTASNPEDLQFNQGQVSPANMHYSEYHQPSPHQGMWPSSQEWTGENTLNPSAYGYPQHGGGEGGGGVAVANPMLHMGYPGSQPDPMMMQPWMSYPVYYSDQGHYSQQPPAGNMPHQAGFYNMIPPSSHPLGGQTMPPMHHPAHVRGANKAKVGGMKVMCPALVEYRSSGRRPTMEELAGHVVEFSRDAHGSRFIQFKMETASVEEKEILVHEVVQDAIGLMQDTFGNYVLQNFLEHATPEQRYKLGLTMKDHMVQLSSQAHGCRVVQRAILLLPQNLRNQLLAELLMNPEDTSKCARNSHATHVMQKVVSLIVEEETERIKNNMPEVTHADAPSTTQLLRAVENAVELDFAMMSVHPHAYRLVLTVMDDCNSHRSEHLERILNSILPASMDRLAKDQHGNFILQHILNRGNNAQKEMVQQFVADHVVELAQHKFGSHLVEKCLSCASASQVETLVQQLIHPTNLNSEQSRLMAHNAQTGQRAGKGAVTKGGKTVDVGDDTLLLLMSDPYANFVVQRAFDASQGQLRKQLVEEIKRRSDILSSFTYGRHILNCTNKDRSEKRKSTGKRPGKK